MSAGELLDEASAGGKLPNEVAAPGSDVERLDALAPLEGAIDGLAESLHGFRFLVEVGERGERGSIEPRGVLLEFREKGWEGVHYAPSATASPAVIPCARLTTSAARASMPIACSSVRASREMSRRRPA